MKKHWLWLPALGLAACGQQLEIASEVALKHQYDAAFQQQIKRLQAEQVKISVTAPNGTGPTVLILEVLNPKSPPGQHPDTLKLRVRKLAHLLVADLASPDRYQVVNAQATFKSGGFFSSGSSPNTSSSQAFIYPIASLK